MPLPPIDILHYKRFTIDTITWTPIIAPNNCNAVTLLNESDSDITLRTDFEDSSTEKILFARNQEIMLGKEKAAPFRWYEGCTVLYAQASAGTGPIHGSFLL